MKTARNILLSAALAVLVFKSCQLESCYDVVDDMLPEIKEMIQSEHPNWGAMEIAEFYLENRDSLESEYLAELQYEAELDERMCNNPAYRDVDGIIE